MCDNLIITTQVKVKQQKSVWKLTPRSRVLPEELIVAEKFNKFPPPPHPFIDTWTLLPLDPFLSQINPFHIVRYFCLKPFLILFFHLRLCLPSDHISSVSATKILYVTTLICASNCRYIYPVKYEYMFGLIFIFLI